MGTPSSASSLTPSSVYNEYLTTERAQLDTNTDALNNLIATIRMSGAARSPLTDYTRDLDAEIATLQQEKYELHQNIRAGRRRFMDDDPQGGVSGVLGLKTRDDKILLTYWIAFSVWLAAVCILAIGLYGQRLGLTTVIKKVGFVVAVYIAAFFASWFFISRYA